MSIFAGVFARRTDQKIPAPFISELQASVSRFPGDTDARMEYTDGKVFIVKVDVGALRESGEFYSSELTAFVAGDPIWQHTTDALPVSRGKVYKR